MSDAPDDRRDGDTSTSTGMETPAGADDEEFAGDEITEATPPHADEGEDAPEAG